MIPDGALTCESGPWRHDWNWLRLRGTRLGPLDLRRRPRLGWWARRPRRSRNDRMVAGVAGGLARMLRVDPILIRIAFVVLALFGGSGILLYALGWLLLRVRRRSGLARRRRCSAGAGRRPHRWWPSASASSVDRRADVHVLLGSAVLPDPGHRPGHRGADDAAPRAPLDAGAAAVVHGPGRPLGAEPVGPGLPDREHVVGVSGGPGRRPQGGRHRSTRRRSGNGTVTVVGGRPVRGRAADPRPQPPLSDLPAPDAAGRVDAPRRPVLPTGRTTPPTNPVPPRRPGIRWASPRSPGTCPTRRRWSPNPLRRRQSGDAVRSAGRPSGSHWWPARSLRSACSPAGS